MCHPKVHIDLEFYFIFHHKTIVSNYGCFRLKFKTLPKSLGIILKKKLLCGIFGLNKSSLPKTQFLLYP